MPIQSPSFKRLVLGLQPSAADHTVRVAVELADLLQVELLGLFLDDSSLRHLAHLPFAREFRGPAAGWQRMDIERVSRDLQAAADSLKRIFEQATRQLETAARFEVARGSLAESVAAVSRADDIFVVTEPINPAERMTSQFALLSKAAFQSAAAVLLVPSRVARSKGPIVAIATKPNDTSIAAAAFFAIVTKEALTILHVDQVQGLDDEIRKIVAEGRLRIEQISAARRILADPATCARAFGHLQERLIVMSRGGFDAAVASAIAAARQVPVLILDRPQG